MDAWGLIILGSITGVVFELGHKYTNINVYKNAHLIYYYFDSIVLRRTPPIAVVPNVVECSIVVTVATRKGCKSNHLLC